MVEVETVKRGLESDALVKSENKRLRADDCEVHLMIPSNAVGSVIGKGGDKIKQLRNINDAKIRVPDCTGPERVVNIRAQTYGDILNVVQKILGYMSENKALDKQEIRLLIHKSVIGGVIGKGGSVIKKIRGSSGAEMRVYSKCAPMSTYRCLAIKGSNDQIISALKEVTEVMSLEEIKEPDYPYAPHNFDVLSAKDYGGYGGRLYSRMNSIARDLEVRRESIGFPLANTSNLTLSKLSDLTMPLGNIGMKSLNESLIPGLFGESLDLQGMGNLMAGGIQNGNLYNLLRKGVEFDQLGQLNYPTPSVRSADKATVTVNMTIPNEKVGAIIGPSGSRISKIRSASLAQIKIMDSDKSKERAISISGTKESIQKAKIMIKQCLSQVV